MPVHSQIEPNEAAQAHAHRYAHGIPDSGKWEGSHQGASRGLHCVLPTHSLPFCTLGSGELDHLDVGALVLCGSRRGQPMALWPQTKVGRRVRPGPHPSGRHPARGHPGWQGPATKGHCCSVAASCIGRPPGGGLAPPLGLSVLGGNSSIAFSPALLARTHSALPLENSLSVNKRSPKFAFQLFPVGAPAQRPQGGAGHFRTPH